jgi:hypothetical protein
MATLCGALLAAPLSFADDYDPKEPEVYATINLGKKRRVWDAQFSPDGKTLAYIESGEKIVLWDVAKKETVSTFKPDDKRYYYTMTWQPDGKALIAGEFGRVYHIDIVTAERKKLYTHDSTVQEIRYLPEKKLIVSSGDLDGCVKFWDAEKGKEVKEIKYTKENFVHDIAAVPGTSKVVVNAEVVKKVGDKITSMKDELFTIDLNDYSVKTIFDDSPVDKFDRLGATHAGELAYGQGKRVVFTDLATLKTRTTGKGPYWPSRILFTQNDRYLIAIGVRPHLIPALHSPGGMAVYDMKAEKWTAYWELMADGHWAMSYSESANLIAFGSDRHNTITVWDMKGIIDPAAKPKKK